MAYRTCALVPKSRMRDIVVGILNFVTTSAAPSRPGWFMNVHYLVLAIQVRVLPISQC